MLKAIGLIQMSLAPIFVVPAFTGQSGTHKDLDAQLDATLQSIAYLAGLRSDVRTGDAAAVRALTRATEPPRDATPQRAAHMLALQDEIARLRYSLDRLLSSPDEVAAITSMPPSVVRVLGLGGAGSAASEPARAGGAPFAVIPGEPGAAIVPGDQGDLPRAGSPVQGAPAAVPPGAASVDPSNPALSSPSARPPFLTGMAPTTGLDAEARRSMTTELAPLDSVSPSSRRRGTEAVPLEEDSYVADATALGRLLVRAGRAAEAVELLERNQQTSDARYWLARAYQNLDRKQEALDIYRALVAEEAAGEARGAKMDLEFLEFQLQFEAGRKKR